MTRLLKSAAISAVQSNRLTTAGQKSPYYRNGGMKTDLAESHAPAVKHNVITIEKAMGMIKRYLQLTTVMAAKQRANAHAVLRISARVVAGSPPSCHAIIAANR